MEKYSAYRDPGTGVQPFLPLVPPPPNLLVKLSIPLAFLVGAVRTAAVLVLLIVHLILVQVVSIIFIPVPILHRFVTHIFTAFTARLSLAVLGVFWISVDNVTRKRGRGVKDIEAWRPRAGDIIVSNWVSWVEILWLAFRFNPIFVLPVAESGPSPAPTLTSEAISHTPGRRTGTGSANITATSRAITARAPILGFRQVSLVSVLRLTGSMPATPTSGPYQNLEDIRKLAGRPIAVFPECTTSNGRALLRFADVFQQKVPVRGYNVFVMCVRYDPPTRFATTLAHSIPTALNPLSHLFSVATSLAPQAVSIRLLAPSESPGSQLFLASEVLTGSNENDQLADACAALIAQIGKMKRTGMGWEDKVSFLQLFHRKEKR
ncbi:hypothetical protein DFH08DRAFT_909156 [Mycena albidolilacea]|uniref:Phospholipid/glycerol acyltransferase domain-containing protein n=1 Tax=Mycena albidolilacea TaxID=1033008 RepID=A0AAD7F6Y2_9AGAR|nr:hypothetical protein DFH08DRAFT_909156 [Mycena albidolilacea]